MRDEDGYHGALGVFFYRQTKILMIILDATCTHFINDMYVSRFHHMSNQQTSNNFFLRDSLLNTCIILYTLIKFFANSISNPKFYSLFFWKL